MPDDGPRSLREDLATLRIEREEPRARPRWVGAAWVVAILAVFLLLSWAAYRWTLGATPEVEIAYARRAGGVSASLLSGSGYVVTGDRYISLGVRVPGRVEAYLVEEGQRVEEGDALVRLDDRHYSVSLREARATLRVASANLALRRKELARLRELRRRDFASQAELDVKQNELEVSRAEIARLEARIAQLELDLEETIIRAPSGGVILEKLKEDGEMATPGGFAGSGDVIRMANLDEMRAEVDIAETDLARVQMGQPAEVIPDAYTDRRYAARVVKLYPQINRQKGTLRLEVRIDDPDEWLRPDMSVRIDFLDPESGQAPEQQRVLAPRAAVRSDAAGEFVWVVRERRVGRQAIETRGSQATDAVVHSGLLGGEALVVGSAESLRDGDQVEIRE